MAIGLVMQVGGKSRLACSWSAIARPMFFWLFEQCDCLPDSRALCTAGSKSPTNVPMIASTANNLTIVNPECSWDWCVGDGMRAAMQEPVWNSGQRAQSLRGCKPPREGPSERVLEIGCRPTAQERRGQFDQ